MEMDYHFDIDEKPFVATIEYRCTFKGYPASGPTPCCGGEPAAAPEFDYEVTGIHAFGGEDVAMVPWLVRLIEQSDRLYDKILEDWEVNA